MKIKLQGFSEWNGLHIHVYMYVYVLYCDSMRWWDSSIHNYTAGDTCVQKIQMMNTALGQPQAISCNWRTVQAQRQLNCPDLTYCVWPWKAPQHSDSRMDWMPALDPWFRRKEYLDDKTVAVKKEIKCRTTSCDQPWNHIESVPENQHCTYVYVLGPQVRHLMAFLHVKERTISSEVTCGRNITDAISPAL